MKSEKNTIRVSVLIPTKNGAATIAEVLSMLSIQTVDIAEILVFDSGSTDDTLDILSNYPVIVEKIHPDEFDHGGTRTLMGKRAKGDFLVFFTQDAIPKRTDSIEQLLKPLMEDWSIAASYGRQFPGFNADHFAESLRWFNYHVNPQVYCLHDKDEAGIRSIFTSNSFSCFRRSSLQEIDYFTDGLIFGEDTVAVGKLLRKGYKNAYVPSAEVYHSHNNTVVEDFRRYFDIGVLHSKEVWLLETFGNAAGQGWKYLLHELALIKKKAKYTLLPELFLRVFMKYCGYKLGRYYDKLPYKLLPVLSMHRNWWQKKASYEKD